MKSSRLALVALVCGALAACAGFGGDRRLLGRSLASGDEVAADGPTALALGDRFLSAGEPDRALAAYIEAALSDMGPTVEVRTAMANANLGLGRLNQAEELLRGAVVDEPRNAAVRNNLGVALMGKGRVGEAYRMFRIASALSPSSGIRRNLDFAEARLWSRDYGHVELGDHLIVRRADGVYGLRLTGRAR